MDDSRDRLTDLLDSLDVRANRDQLLEILESVVRLATNWTERIDLKITNASLKEMAEAFAMFAPYRGERKISMFGSARTGTRPPFFPTPTRWTPTQGSWWRATRIPPAATSIPA